MTKVRFDQIAKEVRNTFSGDKAGVPIVGLEHIIPNELLLSDHDIDTENTFTKAFKKGQILFGRRRAYQQKAAVATFDGICSGDITVIEPLNGAVCPELLPFIIQNERFFEHAVRGSAGSLSPRVKWEHLASYEIELPSYEEQVKLANELWAAYNLKTSYKTLLVSIDEMVKSQFIEMFKDAPIVKLGEHINTQSGGTPNTKKTEYYEGGDIPWLSSGEVNQGYINGTENYITKAGLDNSSAKWSPEHSIVIAMYGATAGKVGYLNIPVTTNQAVCTLLPSSSFVPKFLYYAVSNKSSWMVSQCQGAAQPNISQSIIRKMEIPMPEKSLQREFVLIVEQADKSKFELRKSIEAIDKVIKSLINS